jgi:hypothetical protein
VLKVPVATVKSPVLGLKVRAMFAPRDPPLLNWSSVLEPAAIATVLVGDEIVIVVPTVETVVEPEPTMVIVPVALFNRETPELPPPVELIVMLLVVVEMVILVPARMETVPVETPARENTSALQTIVPVALKPETP